MSSNLSMVDNLEPSPPVVEEEDEGPSGMSIIVEVDKKTIPSWLKCMSTVCNRTLQSTDRVIMGGCGHVICSEECLQKLPKEKTELGKMVVKCPACSVEVPDLSEWLFVKDTFEIAVSVKDVKLICGCCIFNHPADGYCKECKMYLCSNCAEMHKTIRLTKNHTLETKPEELEARRALEFRRMAKEKNRCKVHPTESAVLLCVPCKVSVCTMCCQSDHHQHEVRTVAECMSMINKDIVAAEALHAKVNNATTDLVKKFNGLPTGFQIIVHLLNREFATLISLSLRRSLDVRQRTENQFREEHLAIYNKVEMLTFMGTMLMRFQRISESILVEGDDETFVLYETILEPIITEMSELADQLKDMDEFVGSNKVFQMSTKWTRQIERFMKEFGAVAYGVPVKGPTYTKGRDGGLVETTRMGTDDETVTTLMGLLDEAYNATNHEPVPRIHAEIAARNPILRSVAMRDEERNGAPPAGSVIGIVDGAEHIPVAKRTSKRLLNPEPGTSQQITFADYSLEGDDTSPEFVADGDGEELPCCSKAVTQQPPPCEPTPKRRPLSELKCKETQRQAFSPFASPVTMLRLNAAQQLIASGAQLTPGSSKHSAPSVAQLPIVEPPMGEQVEVPTTLNEQPRGLSDEPIVTSIDDDGEPIDMEVETVDPNSCDDEKPNLLPIPTEHSTPVAHALSSEDQAQGREQEAEATNSTSNGQQSGADGEGMISGSGLTAPPMAGSNTKFDGHSFARPDETHQPLPHVIPNHESTFGEKEEDESLSQSVFKIPSDVAAPTILKRNELLQMPGIHNHVIFKPQPRRTTSSQQLAKLKQDAALKRASVEQIVRPAGAGGAVSPWTAIPKVVLVRHTPPHPFSSTGGVIVSSTYNQTGLHKAHQQSPPSTMQAPGSSATSQQQIKAAKGPSATGSGVRSLGSVPGTSTAVDNLPGQGVTRIVNNGAKPTSPEQSASTAKSAKRQEADTTAAKAPTDSEHGFKLAEVATQPPPTVKSPVALVKETAPRAKSLLQTMSTHVGHVSVAGVQSPTSAKTASKGAAEGFKPPPAKKGTPKSKGFAHKIIPQAAATSAKVKAPKSSREMGEEHGSGRWDSSSRSTAKAPKFRTSSPAMGPVLARIPNVEPDVRGFVYVDPRSVEERPGYGQMKITNVDANEDYCEICKDGGDDPIICCDECPKVFHAKCHIPELQTAPEEDPWACGVHWSVEKIASMFAAQAVEGCRELVPANPKGYATACKFVLRCYQLPNMEHMRWDFPAGYFSMYGKYPAHLKYIRERLTLQNPESFASTLEMLSTFRQMFQQAAMYYYYQRKRVLHIPAVCFDRFLELMKDIYPEFLNFFNDITLPNDLATRSIASHYIE